MKVAARTLRRASQEVTFRYLLQGGKLCGEQAIMAVLWFIWVLCSVQENMIFLSGQGFVHSRVTGEEWPHKLLLITDFYWADLQSAPAHSSTKTQGDFSPPYLKASVCRKPRDITAPGEALVDAGEISNVITSSRFKHLTLIRIQLQIIFPL